MVFLGLVIFYLKCRKGAVANPYSSWLYILGNPGLSIILPLDKISSYDEYKITRHWQCGKLYSVWTHNMQLISMQVISNWYP
jgi:hypothetical protein